MPLDARAELAQDEERERRRADPVDVVVAVNADPLAARNGGEDPLDRGAHVAEEERIVLRRRAFEERTRALGFFVPAPDENARRQLADPERVDERAYVPVRAGTDRPSAVLHRTSHGTKRVGRIRPQRATRAARFRVETVSARLLAREIDAQQGQPDEQRDGADG